MYVGSSRSCLRFIVLAIFTACLSHRKASAEAFSSSAVRRSTLSNHPSKDMIGHNTPNPSTDSGCIGNDAEYSEDISRSARPRSLLSLRCGGEQHQSASKFWSKTMYREMLAEFIGTFIIVQLGTGAVMSAIFTDALVGLFQIASVWIISVTLAICTTGPISGAHLNPAVSISFALLRPCKAFGWSKVIPYIVSQTMGAIFASSINLLMYASQIRAFESANNIVRGTAASIASASAFGEYYVDPITTPIAFFAEAFGTAILTFVIFSLTHPKNDTMKNGVYIPTFIGATIGGLVAVFAPITGAGFNPARDFGPRIVAWLAGWERISFQGWWVYVVAPIVGAPVGAWVADKLLYRDEPETAYEKHYEAQETAAPDEEE